MLGHDEDLVHTDGSRAITVRYHRVMVNSLDVSDADEESDRSTSSVHTGDRVGLVFSIARFLIELLEKYLSMGLVNLKTHR